MCRTLPDFNWHARVARSLSDSWASCSTRSQVWSSVPQGSVLGPVLFLIFINDLDDELTSNVLKFADDTKIYHPVNSEIEGGSLQQDLVTVSNWAKKWQMEFNVSKCKTMHFGKKNFGYKYSMNGHALEEVATEKDLGVTFSSDLKSATHCKDCLLYTSPSPRD